MNRITDFPVKILIVTDNQIYFIGSHNEIRVFTLTADSLERMNERDRNYIQRTFKKVKIAGFGFLWSHKTDIGEIYFGYDTVYDCSKILSFDEMLEMLRIMHDAKKLKTEFMQKVITAMLK